MNETFFAAAVAVGDCPGVDEVEAAAGAAIERVQGMARDHASSLATTDFDVQWGPVGVISTKVVQIVHGPHGAPSEVLVTATGTWEFRRVPVPDGY